MSNTAPLPVALVTGAARGIGRAIALQLARDGYAVAINYVSSTQHAEELRHAITSAGGRAECIRADVSSADDRRALIDAIRDRFGRIDLLVNNAGVAPAQRADLLDATEQSFTRMIDVNLRGPYFLTQAIARWMIELKQQRAIERGRIAFVTSVSAYATSVNRGDYCVSKAGLSMAAQLWAARLAEFEIPVIEIRPGIIATDMTTGVKEKYDKLIAEGLLPQARWGTPDDVARAVSAFARGDLDYSTGVAIDVSGGFQIRRL
jgi:NAD(P)-dependent dehydrogenase (short-subunit alcohol dehydrogenase family)